MMTTRRIAALAAGLVPVPSWLALADASAPTFGVPSAENFREIP